MTKLGSLLAAGREAELNRAKHCICKLKTKTLSTHSNLWQLFMVIFMYMDTVYIHVCIESAERWKDIVY